MLLFYNLSTILTIVSSFYGFILFLFNLKSSKTNKFFTFYTLSVFLWSLFYLLFTNTTDPHLSMQFMQLSVGAAIFIPPTFLHFSTHLINKYNKNKLLIILSYVYSVLLYSTVFSPLFIHSVQRIPPLTFFPIGGPTYHFLVLEYFVLIGLGLFLIYKEIPEVPRNKQVELKWVFWGVLLAYLGGATNFPLNYNIPIYPIGNSLVSLYMIFITYAILKYQSFDIKFILRKSIIYTFLITFITIVYLLLTLIIENIFRTTFGYKSISLSLLVSIFIGLLFIPLKNTLEKLLFKNSFIKFIEENQLLRQEIGQTERLKSVAILASGMAHEIKNPLTALKTFSEYLPKKIDDKEFLKKFAPIIASEVNRIDALVHELLDFAKPAPVILKPTDLISTLSGTIDILNNDFIKNKINLNKDFISRAIILPLDVNQFKQALLNIFLNAIDAMPQGGTLTLSIQKELTRVLIRIQDTGVGIDKMDMQHIFDPFYTKKDQGTGLGLSITHEIIKNHNGKIFVESSIGQGTTFIIELPYNSPL